MTRSFLATACLLGVAVLIAGCGPFDRPMPTRLDADQQKQVDASWNNALAPIGKHDRQQWLDTLVGTQAYQAGVDSLTFRSVKNFAGGKVVMEMFFDRDKPAEDRFVVTVFDKSGKQLRQEKYNRDEVTQTANDLFDPNRNATPQANEPPQRAQQRATIEQRWQQIGQMFPQPIPPKK